MALAKPITLATRETAAYHRILRVNVDKALESVRVEVQSFKDAAARTEGAKAFPARGYAFALNEVFPTSPETEGLFWAKLYSKLKTLPEFDGATDC